MLVYDSHDYAQYELPVPEDGIKKYLEITLLASLVDVRAIRRSLDIGTATCRYPRYLSQFGVDAFGVDINTAGYRYVRPQLTEKISFVQADARYMPFADGLFDLVSCMMGTLNHIRIPDRGMAVREMARVLRPRGQVVISAWDSQCEFQGYLSIFSPDEINQFTAEPVDPEGLEWLLSDAGFVRLRRIRFNCFPDQLARNFGHGQQTSDYFSRIVDLDVEARSSVRDPPAQMFMVVGELA